MNYLLGYVRKELMRILPDRIAFPLRFYALLAQGSNDVSV